jgi:hypothetical protein
MNAQINNKSDVNERPWGVKDRYKSNTDNLNAKEIEQNDKESDSLV